MHFVQCHVIIVKLVLPWELLAGKQFGDVTLNAAKPGIFTTVIFGMARAFGEALAVQMVVGNSVVIPTSLTTPAATLTSVLTMGIGNTVMGTVSNNVLWSLALVLLLMESWFQYVGGIYHS